MALKNCLHPKELEPQILEGAFHQDQGHQGLYHFCQPLGVKGREEDKIQRILFNKGVNEVKGLYNTLISCDNGTFPWKPIWKSITPLRETFFVWTATLKKILASDNLRKRHVMVSGLLHFSTVVCTREMGKLWIIFYYPQQQI